MPAVSSVIDPQQLCRVAQRARLATQPYRVERFNAVQQYLGQHSGVQGTSEKVPVNLIAEYIRVVGRSLVAKNPRTMLSTFDRSKKPIVSASQAWANQKIIDLRLQETMQRTVVDALFWMGICKVALCDPARAAASAWGLKAAEPFCELIDPDDYVWDVHARNRSQLAYEGHRYRVPLATVRDSSLYSKTRKNLTADMDRLFNEQGDERINVLGRGTLTGNDEELEDMVSLWEFYLPRHRLILTFEDSAGPQCGSDGEPLRVQQWVGSDNGPYYQLGYGVIPGAIPAKGPVHDLVDLHEACNIAYRKVVRIVDRIKENTFVEGSAAEDGERLRDANDGDIIPVRRPDAIKQVVSSGQAIQQVLAVAMHLRDLFSQRAGNLDLLGGQGPQSKTAAQDEMLNQNAGAGMADMQQTTVDYVSRVLKGLCWYWHHDPVSTQSTTHSLKSAAHIAIRRHVTPGMRQSVPFDEMQIEVDPYSMQHQTPQTKMAALDQIMTQVLAPLAPLLASQGIVTDFNAYLKLKSEWMNMPEVADIMTIQQPQDPSGGGEGRGSAMPIQTERTYNRVSTPGRTQQGNDQQMIASMLGHDLGGAQKNGAPK